jgi:threonylcarbamoyladenosine tRNA methylthiotransferase MtaB
VLGAAGRAGIVDAVEKAVSQGQRKPKLDMPDIVNEKVYEPIALGDFDSGERVRAFLKIQDGCDNFCSYCIIPYARGPQRSRGLDDALNEARFLAAKGFKEIVLTGIHVTSYGQDHKNSDLTGLMRRLHEMAGIERIRLGSMDPVSINIPFLEALKEMPKVCRHFHMSLQSGCDKTLKRMNRRYTSQFYREAVAMARGLFPLASFTTDMIAGFPGETEDDFNQSLEFAREMGFAKIHAFPYSKVAGTPAAGFPGQLQRAEKARRALKLIELGEETGRAYRSMFLGKRLKVLFEREASPGIWDGLADNYMRVRAPFKEDATNRLLAVEMHSLQEGFAIGAICEDSLQ